MSTGGSKKSLEERHTTPVDASATKDRFSKNYKNIFQGAGSRISSLFLKPTAEPTVREQPEPPKEITFKKFKNLRKLPSGTKLSEIDVATCSAIVNGDYSTDKPTSQKPSGISTKEWFAVNAFIMYNSAIRYYGWLSQHCTSTTCPRMTAGQRYEFKWADGKRLHVPKSTPASEYAMNVLVWVEYQFKDVAIFPNYDGAYYSRHRFLPVVQDIFKRLLRIYAHILNHHMDALELAQVDKEFIKFLRHFLDVFDRYDLLVEKDVKPVTRSIVCGFFGVNLYSEGLIGSFSETPQPIVYHSPMSCCCFWTRGSRPSEKLFLKKYPFVSEDDFEMATWKLERRPTLVENEAVDKLYHHFLRIDKDRNGVIDKQELLAIPAVAENPLAGRLLEVLDLDRGGTIDFNEFVAGMSIFSKTTSKQKKLKFAFDVYDLDRDGFISNGELFVVLKIMSGDHLKPNELQQVVDKTIRDADKDGDGKISFEEFQALVQSSNSDFLAMWNFDV